MHIILWAVLNGPGRVVVPKRLETQLTSPEVPHILGTCSFDNKALGRPFLGVYGPKTLHCRPEGTHTALGTATRPHPASNINAGKRGRILA